MKNIKITKKLNNVTEKVITGTAIAGITIGGCAVCTAMDLTQSAMAIGAIALLTPVKILNTNVALIKACYKDYK